MSIYDQVAKVTGVDRDTVKRVLHAANYSGQPPSAKSESSDLAIAIGEHAFADGFSAGEEWGMMDNYLRGHETREQRIATAWSDYTPPEDLCGKDF